MRFLHWCCARWRPPTRRSLAVRVDAQLRVRPIDGSGWLAPTGTFIGVAHANHGRVAFEILEPEWRQRSLAYQPDARNYERELEQRRYTKLMKNDYFNGWCNPRFRPSRAQLEIMVDWYLDRGRKLPEWLQQLYGE
jgi:hypothetical protein